MSLSHKTSQQDVIPHSQDVVIPQDIPTRCYPTSREVDNETMAGVNSCFAEVTENDILRVQDITIPNDKKKAKELGMVVFRDEQCFNTQLAHISSVFCPDRQALLMSLSLNSNCPSTLHFKVPSKSTQLPLSKTSPFKKI